MTVEQLFKMSATLNQVEDWMREGRISFETTEAYVKAWNAHQGRFHRAEFSRDSWRSGIKLVEIA